MKPARHFGYEHRANGTVVITRGCRMVGVVRGDAQVLRFLDDMAEGHPQEVLARWVIHPAAGNGGHLTTTPGRSARPRATPDDPA
ncbi:hypothetical protein [Streptomyces vilmorinianum]|uniref:hypothetical protein n=1 Tax=Streptomyces vilmorinianum TaxID=3051092 RepID=UPI0010FB1A42|nr:hypothetical protein [Streptomyces vilmorinianum]